jgi:hypothetical protein
MASNTVKNKMIIQQMLESNTVRAGGDFHSDDFSKESFLQEFNKKFSLKPKNPENNSVDLIENIIKTSTVKVRGRFNAKELKQSLFINKLFENFQVERV